MMLILRMESLSRGVSEPSLSDEYRGMVLQYQTSCMRADSWQTEICSQHSLMTNYVCFDETKSKLITCGEDGQVHVYLRDNTGKYQHTGSLYVFPEAISCVSWADNTVGGHVAVGGSKGGLAILHIHGQNGQITLQWAARFNSAPTSVDWSKDSCELLYGLADGSVLRVTCRQGQWQIAEETRLGDSGSVNVACGKKRLWLAALGNKVVQLRTQPDTEEMQPETILTLPQQINHLLLNSQSSIPNNPELILLTSKKLHFYRLIPGKPVLTQQYPLKLPTQQIGLGWSQSEVICYPKNSQLEQTIKNNQVCAPMSLHRNVNCTWR